MLELSRGKNVQNGTNWSNIFDPHWPETIAHWSFGIDYISQVIIESYGKNH
jgi:hypothetical protein